MINETLLQKLGMSQKEVKLYLKLLEFGTAGANNLGRAIGENRTTTYSLLHAMKKRGLISENKKGKVKTFSATNPQLLINHLLDDAQALKGLLPELLAISNKHAQKPKITFYEGVEGIKQIGEILLEVPGSVRESFMGIDPKTIHPEIKKYYETDFVNRRIEKGILYRGIVTGELPMGNRHQRTEKGQLRELKIIDMKKLPIKIHIDIFPRNKVALYSYRKDELMGIIIESPAFYETMRTVFTLAWAGVDKMS